MSRLRKEMTPEIREYYQALVAKNELFRSDVSIYQSYTNLKLPYPVICRQRLYRDGLKQRRQFIKEIKVQESLQSRALDGVRVHREFCDPIITPLNVSEVFELTRKEKRHLEKILVTDYY